MADTKDDHMFFTDADKIGYDQYPHWLKQRLEWFMDQRFGLIIHWGPYSQWDCCESWPLCPEINDWARNDTHRCWVERDRDFDRFCQDYRALNRTFNPTRFDPDRWADLAVSAGMKYVVYTAKHHDGFCMYDTRTTDYRITHADCPFHANRRADTVRAVFDAFRRRKLGIGCYFSKSDWHCPWYWAPEFPVVDRCVNYATAEHPELWQRFVDYTHQQIRELMTGYGPVDILWLDGGQVQPPSQDIRMDDIVAEARRHHPGLIVADRMVGGHNENFITPEKEIPEQPLGVPWESCMTLGKGWKYYPDNVFKPAGEVIRMLVEIVSKGGNLLLGLGPSPEGEFQPEAEARLREIGDWLAVNGEAIYGTRPLAPYRDGDAWLTCKGDFIYATFFADAQGHASTSLRLSSIHPADGSRVELLGGGSLDWRSHGVGCTISLPAALPPSPAWCVRIHQSGGRR